MPYERLHHPPINVLDLLDLITIKSLSEDYIYDKLSSTDYKYESYSI